MSRKRKGEKSEVANSGKNNILYVTGEIKAWAENVIGGVPRVLGNK